MACALRAKPWKLGGTTGPGQKPRERAVAARPQVRVLQDIAQATRRFGLPDTAPVVRGDDAGREGFWRHRFLHAQEVTNCGVDAAAIAVNRRTRRATSDAMAVRQLGRMFMRSHHGEREVGRVVPGPSVAAAAQRHLPRDLDTLQPERASTTTRIKGVLRSQGVQLTRLTKWPEPLDALRRWAGAPLPSGRRRRVLRVYAPPQFLREQSAAVAAERRAVLHSSQDTSLEPVRQLMHLRGSGSKGSGGWVREFLAWRDLKNRREVGG